ncbi:thiamine phosphate synthase [Staphylococcus simulans]|uniref:thiamine phosphate synthase n=1 Tax=Staphylococcus simulans TaxID=1286 RepID=UPI000D1DB1C2|nr:thiamine phosphate synthase [Staphylococcus simulans]PTI92668.1 thiamine phosphate synthase [Staphylococcus simulans]PTJ04546.1 thiamine phosphate synthase [Staphylococcus simulans]PTJ10503.1 thiamine phosphate synthase [Staphylococcus simulans]PTJ40476.1 thiamine phosphate synthase [Staphylococcus simulans]PTJ97001.1 thiamine phosphate synthase [Staphylococcus simulans]
MFQPEDLKVYFICGTQDIPEGRTIHEVLTEALEGGITMYQFREKGPNAKTGDAKKELAQSLKQLCEQYHVPFIVNDDVELAELIDADGIHVGQDDAKVNTFKTHFKNKIIGLSVGNETELAQSDLTDVDYIGVGPIFKTGSKDDASDSVGTEMIETLHEKTNGMPIVAIGGIALNNVEPIAQTHAQGVSVISAIAQSSNVKETVRNFLQYFK